MCCNIYGANWNLTGQYHFLRDFNNKEMLFLNFGINSRLYT